MLIATARKGACRSIENKPLPCRAPFVICKENGTDQFAYGVQNCCNLKKKQLYMLKKAKIFAVVPVGRGDQAGSRAIRAMRGQWALGLSCYYGTG